MKRKPPAAKKAPAPAGRWRIVLDGKELESYISEEVARRRYRAMQGSKAGARAVKLLRPDGEVDD